MGFLTRLVKNGEIRPSHSYKTILEQREEKDQLNSWKEQHVICSGAFWKQKCENLKNVSLSIPTYSVSSQRHYNRQFYCTRVIIQNKISFCWQTNSFWVLKWHQTRRTLSKSFHFSIPEYIQFCKPSYYAMFINSVIIHGQEKTKETTTVKEVWDVILIIIKFGELLLLLLWIFQNLLMDISITRKSVSYYFQTPRNWLKKKKVGCALDFNPLLAVWKSNEKHFLVRMMCYSRKWHRYTRKKEIRLLLSGVEPKTFRLLVRMLYHWATGDSCFNI